MSAFSRAEVPRRGHCTRARARISLVSSRATWGYRPSVVPAPGAMLTPNLRLLSLLGHGGMGSVWRAEHLVLGKQVAVKLLAKDLAEDAEAHARFVREATLLGQLKSPHVVAVHDFGDSEGTPFFVMELLEGEDLGDRLERVHALPLGTVTAILSQLCKALDRIHEIGVVHRDLKPGNVFLTKVDGDLVVKLVDFGIAKNPEASFKTTSTGALLGTPLYMSPEQVLSTRDVGPASDLYSLGVLVYECLAGEPPFSGETLGAIHVAITQGRFTPISKRVAGLHPALDGWFSRALASDPKARFGSAREMAEAFLAASRGIAPIASTTARLGSSPAFVASSAAVDPARHTRRAAVAVGLALVAGITLAWALVASGLLSRGTAASASASASAPAPASPSASALASASAPTSALPVDALPAATTSDPTPSAATPASVRRPIPRRKDRGF